MRFSRRGLLRLNVWLVAVVLGAAVASAYAVAIGGRGSVGALNGLVIAGGIAALEMYVLEGRSGRILRQFGVAWLILSTTVAWALLILATLESARSVFGHPWGAGIGDHPHSSSLQDLAFSFAVGFLISFIARLQGLIGFAPLVNFLIGRYAKPVREEKVVMILDIADSTALAEQLGDLRVQELISRLFTDISETIIEHEGEIHQYIGDAIVVTWPLTRGTADACCLRCISELQRLVADRAERYRAKFGAVPYFRAGLHCGPVVIGEVGDTRRAIAYFGDTMNTTARLQQVCKELGRRVLVSGNLASAIDPPPGIELEPMGDIELQGKEKPISVFALLASMPCEQSA